MSGTSTGTDADCFTCHGDPAVCANVPGLRRCEKAMRHDAPSAPMTAEEERMVDAFMAAHQDFQVLFSRSVLAGIKAAFAVSDMGRIDPAIVRVAQEYLNSYPNLPTNCAENIMARALVKNAAPQAQVDASVESESPKGGQAGYSLRSRHQ